MPSKLVFFRQNLVETFHAIKAGNRFSSCSPPKFLRLKDCYSCLSLLFVTSVSSFKILIKVWRQIKRFGGRDVGFKKRVAILGPVNFRSMDLIGRKN